MKRNQTHSCVVLEIILDSLNIYRKDMFLSFSLNELIRIWKYGLKIICLSPEVWKKKGTGVEMYYSDAIVVKGGE